MVVKDIFSGGLIYAKVSNFNFNFEFLPNLFLHECGTSAFAVVTKSHILMPFKDLIASEDIFVPMEKAQSLQ